MTEFIPSDQTIWWNNSKAAQLISEYKLIFGTGSIYEAYLFSFICKADRVADLVGSATTIQEVLDLIEASEGRKLICLLTDNVAPDCGAAIAAAVKMENCQSHCILVVNDPQKLYSLPGVTASYSALCSSGNLGRGGLYRCLEAVLVEGLHYVDPVLTQAFAELDEKGVALLNSRERDILVYVAEGLTNKEIARQIFIAERTVRDYISSILSKLGASNRAAAAAWAIKHGIAAG